MERPRIPRYEPFNLMEYVVSGNLYLLEAFVKHKNTNYIFDSDGVKINSPKKVLGTCELITDVLMEQSRLDRWDFISHRLTENGMPENEARQFERLWYKPDMLRESEPYLLMRPLLRLLARERGRNKLHVLTARRTDLTQATIDSYRCHYPMIPKKNILIRKDDGYNPEQFKKDEIARRLKRGPAIFIDDSFANLKMILCSPEFANCLCIHVPLGVVKPEFNHERLIVVGRFPFEEQGMLPLYELIKMYVAQC